MCWASPPYSARQERQQQRTPAPAGETSVGLKWKANPLRGGQPRQGGPTSPHGSALRAASEASGTGNNQLQDLKFTVEKRRNPRTPCRDALHRPEPDGGGAGGARFRNSPVYIVHEGQKREGDYGTEFETGGRLESDIMTIEYGPEDTELSWQYSAQGLVTSSVLTEQKRQT